MRLYQAGERSVGICEPCGCKVGTRMEYRDYTPTGGGAVTVPDVLVAVCERCESVVAIPHQSTPKINRHRKAKPQPMRPITARVPRALEEVLDLVASSVGASSAAMVPAIYRYYMIQITLFPEVATAVKSRCDAFLASGKANYRVVVKVRPSQLVEVMKAAKAAGIQTKAELLRGVAVLAADDCGITYPDRDGVQVIREPNPASKARRAFLKDLASTIG